jgi:hypothetical protein
MHLLYVHVCYANVHAYAMRVKVAWADRTNGLARMDSNIYRATSGISTAKASAAIAMLAPLTEFHHPRKRDEPGIREQMRDARDGVS